MQVMPQPIQTDKQLSHIFFTFTNLHFSHPRCIYINTLHLPTQDNVPNTSLKHTKTNLVKVFTSTSKFNTKKADEKFKILVSHHSSTVNKHSYLNLQNQNLIFWPYISYTRQGNIH